MLNKDNYMNDIKFHELSDLVKKAVIILDDELENQGYSYNGIWRDDLEPGGNISIFEVANKKGRIKNLITLRPQTSFLKVEVYWGANDKHYFNVYNDKSLPNKMLEEIKRMYNKISL